MNVDSTGFSGKVSSYEQSSPKSQNWGLAPPEKISLDREPKNMNVMLEFSRKRMALMGELTESIKSQEGDYISIEKQSLVNTQKTISGVVDQARIENNANKEIGNTLNNTLSQLESEKKAFAANSVKAYQDLADENTQIAQIQVNIKALNQKKKQIADEIDISSLTKSKLSPEDKSLTRDVYAWCLVVIYSEPESAFYWSNFKAEAFKEKGNDFVLRLKGLKPKLNSEQALISQRIVSSIDLLRQEVAKTQKPAASAILKLFEFIEVIWSINNEYEKLKNLDSEQERIQHDVDMRNCELEKFTSQIQGYAARLETSKRLQSLSSLIVSNMDKISSLMQARVELQPVITSANQKPVYKSPELQTPQEQTEIEVVQAEQSPDRKRAQANVKSQMAPVEFNDEEKKRTRLPRMHNLLKADKTLKFVLIKNLMNFSLHLLHKQHPYFIKMYETT